MRSGGLHHAGRAGKRSGGPKSNAWPRRCSRTSRNSFGRHLPLHLIGVQKKGRARLLSGGYATPFARGYAVWPPIENVPVPIVLQMVYDRARSLF
jgi:hypothetical protein